MDRLKSSNTSAMHKKWIFGFSLLFVSSVVFSQTIDPKIDRAHKDHQTAERAAKADVFIQNKKTVIHNKVAIDKPAINKDTKAACTKTKKKRSARRMVANP